MVYNIKKISIRLPRNYIPTHYDLFLYVKEQQESFDTSVTITFHKNEDDSKVCLNFHPNISILSIIQNGIPLKYDSDYELLTIYRATDPDQDISSNPFTINYTLTPNQYGTIGFYVNDGCYFTKFEPNYAQMFLPCFDDLSVRSTFSVKIKIPSKFVGLSNMPIETTEVNGDEKEISFFRTPPMCTYLLAVFIGEFSSIESETKSGLCVKMYGENGRHEMLKKFLKAAVFAVEWMDKTVPHLQLLSHPGISNGLIALKDYTRGADFLKSLLTVLHEVSHLRFGDLVSIKWWDSVLLNEGFAQLFQYLILRDFSVDFRSDKAHQLYIERDGIRCLNY